MRVAIYARYSSDKQSAASADDQVRTCRAHAEREGWTVVSIFTDEALSGATRARPGLQALLLAAGDVDVVLAESIDRLSRDQEDIAAIHKRLKFAGAQLVTLQDGAVGEIHIGLKGTMAALFLADLGQKTRRGQIGRVAAGRIPGGISYGYRKVRGKLDSRGEAERGLREIHEDEAAIVRRIFAEYLQGRSAIAIARRLNAEGVPSPRGGEWRQNAIMGHRRRRNGILCNDLYAGRIVFNRQRMVRDPVTRRRVSRPNPPDQWITADVPELRIVDADTFAAVQRRLAAGAGRPAHAQRRPRRLFSGLLACSECRGPMTIVSQDRWGCATRKERGSCGNGRTIVNAQLEKRLLGALREQMLRPDLVRAYVLEYHQRRRKNAAAARNARGSIEQRLHALNGKLARIAAAYADGEVPIDEFRTIADPARAERDALRLQLLDFDSEEVIALEPAVELKYRTAIDGLAAALEGDNLNRQEAKAGIRALIDVVVVHPRADARGVELELRGRLAELLALTQKKPAPSREPASDCAAMLVAGARFSRWSAISTAWC